MPKTANAICLEQINFAYDQKIIFENLSLEFSRGKIHGLLGPNGAGKSTLIKIMSGLLTPNKGIVRLLDHITSESPSSFGKYIGLLSDHAPLYPTMQVQDYLMFCAQIKKLSNAQKIVDQLLEKLNLQKVRKNIIQTLSTGFRQRVSLAQALVHNPPILILDEPTSGLDPESAGQLRELMVKLAVDHTILFSSHLLHEVEQICTDVTLVNSGKIVFHGKMMDMLALNKNIKERVYQLSILVPKKFNKDELSPIPEIKVIKIQQVELDKVEIVFSAQDTTSMNHFLRSLLDKKLTVLELKEKRNDLEDIFLKLIHKKDEQ